MKIGLVGYQRSGKSSLFAWLTGVAADPSMAHAAQTAMATVPESRVDQLCGIYHPKKVTLASMEIVDTPGLSRTHEGNAPRLGHIREAGCLVHVVAAFDSVAMADVRSFEEDMMLTDLEIVSGRVDRLRDAIKKPRPNRDEQLAELAAIEPLLEKLESGQTLSDREFSDDQIKATKSFGLLTRKRRLALVNTADDESDPARFQDASLGLDILTAPVGLELELSRMTADEAHEFRVEMDVGTFDRDELIRQLMDLSGQMLFFTAGEKKEVRTWMIQQGATAVEAAGSIHTDMARGFIRAEIMTCDDLVRLGSEREVKAKTLARQEPKDYVIQDGDILNIRLNV